jgi:hypothetical protein
MFTKELVKRKKDAEDEITNDMAGFVSYFTAPNIRYKIKNPLFLAYKFSNFVSIYYNSLRCSSIKVPRLLTIGCDQTNYELLHLRCCIVEAEMLFKEIR